MSFELIKIGCCGFPVARNDYYRNYNIVEVQWTFYDFVDKRTLEKWRAEAPEGFEFVLKAFQFITHSANLPTYKRAKHIDNLNPNKLGNFQPTKEVFNCYETLIEYAEILKTKFIVFQSPASFKPEKENIKNMEEFFNKIGRKGLILGWEPRGKWSPQQIKEVCEEFDLIDVVDPFLRDSTYGRIFYYRLHGGRDYSHQFTDAELKTLAQKIRGRTGYVMFNNITMLADSQRFKSLITRSG